jgi:hypothetical protein
MDTDEDKFDLSVLICAPSAAETVLFLLASLLMLSFATVVEGAGAQARNIQTRLEREVAALSTIHDLGLSDEQLKAIQPLCKEAASERGPSTEPTGSNVYRETLRHLRDALAAGDDDKVNKLQDKLDSLRESEKLELDTDFPIHDAARAKAGAVLAMLSTNQVANYVALHADDIPGATEVLLDGINQCRGQSDADYQALRREATEEVGVLLAGVDQKATTPIEKQVGDLLDKAHRMSDTDFKAQADDLRTAAKKITENSDPIEGLRHWLQRDIATLLANPQAGPAINARLHKTGTSPEK